MKKNQNRNKTILCAGRRKAVIFPLHIFSINPHNKNAIDYGPSGDDGNIDDNRVHIEAYPPAAS